jgi:hypothetical protein
MTQTTHAPPVLEPAVQRLTADLKTAARKLSDREARYLVDLYYQWQRNRIRAGHQERALTEAAEPAVVFDFVQGQAEALENQIRRALQYYVEDHPVGGWLIAQAGIGPIIAAGLLAHIDIRKAPTVGHIWRYAGLDPTMRWEKGQKRPWNAALKLVCWKAGQSFVKVSNKETAVYGAVYRERKALEVERNNAGLFADQAKAALEAKRFGKDTEAFKHYEQGRLPPARLELRAQRYAVKLFLSHLHHVWWRWETGTDPVKPYVITHMQHAHYIEPPGPVVPPKPSTSTAP